MIRYNDALNAQLFISNFDKTYISLLLFKGTPPSRSDILAQSNVLNANKGIHPYYIQLAYRSDLLFYHAQALSTGGPLNINTPNLIKSKFSLAANTPSLNVYVADGQASWFMLSFNDGNYPVSSRASVGGIQILGTVGDLNSSADVKLSDIDITSDTSFNYSDIVFDVDPYEFMG